MYWFLQSCMLLENLQQSKYVTWQQNGWARRGSVWKNKKILVNYGLSHNMDRIENAPINIKGIEGYKMPLPENEFQMTEKTNSWKN